ncbi:hypothetical protein GQ53DRAFT_797366 [Thozetella sp. PMI_491]|nr:hypothetical protein GQ53DRAFT_797366 [Thozetella sp. PMI_491]
MPDQDAELLVHIAAPSRAADDTRYRSLAQAYVDFEPVSRTSLFPAESRQQTHGDGEPANLSSQPVELPSFISSVELSFGSASDNLRSPRVLALPTDNAQQEAAGSWHPPPSVIEDSMPDNNLAMPQFCSPTRILEYYLSGFESNHAMVGDPSSTPLQSSSSRADSEPPQNKRRRSSLMEDPPQGLGRSTSDMGPRQEFVQEQIKTLHSRKLRRSCQSLDGLEIHAPAPPVSCADVEPSMMVTEQLAKLARDADMSRHFVEPRVQTRELRALERGHWYVDCAGWSMNKRQEIWRFLTNYVGAGEAGWGVWCRRDAAFTYLRLFCWGQIVGHMYLMLYLATKRDILYMRVSWIGADGQDVITMPARKRSSSSAKGKGKVDVMVAAMDK